MIDNMQDLYHSRVDLSFHSRSQACHLLYQTASLQPAIVMMINQGSPLTTMLRMIKKNENNDGTIVGFGYT